MSDIVVEWPVGQELPIPKGRDGTPIRSLPQSFVAAAWASTQTLMTAEGWRFRQIDRGVPGVVKFGGRVTREVDVRTVVAAFMEAIEKTFPNARSGIVLVRSAPCVVDDGATVRARFGWAKDEDALEDMLR